MTTMFLLKKDATYKYTAFRGILRTEKKIWEGNLWYFLQTVLKIILESNVPLDILLKLHIKYVGNAKILINMSDISTDFGAAIVW